MRWSSLRTSSSIRLFRYKFHVVDAPADLTWSDDKAAASETPKIFVEFSTVRSLAVAPPSFVITSPRFIPQWQVPGGSLFLPNGY